MQRDKWQFEFTASKLAGAAKNKKLHHQERLKFWEEAKTKVMAEVKDTGIEVSESQAGGSYTHTNRFGEPTVLVRTDLQKRISECHSKIQEHNGKVREYEGWVQVLGGNPESRLALTADDYLYFFGT